MARDWSLVAVFGSLALLLFPVVVGLAFLARPAFGRAAPAVGWTLLVVAVVAALVVAVRRERRGGQSVWALVPSWQYTGRHAESGGLARDEQEAALADVEEQAERREHGPR